MATKPSMAAMLLLAAGRGGGLPPLPRGLRAPERREGCTCPGWCGVPSHAERKQGLARWKRARKAQKLTVGAPLARRLSRALLALYAAGRIAAPLRTGMLITTDGIAGSGEVFRVVCWEHNSPTLPGWQWMSRWKLAAEALDDPETVEALRDLLFEVTGEPLHCGGGVALAEALIEAAP